MAHERLQGQAVPQLQASPHGQPVFAVSALGLWQPHWQAAPGQDLQEHCVALDMFFLLSMSSTCCQQNEFLIEGPAGY